ncbi:MAG: aminotransferase class V-fold PLP-dependent enzyme [Bryobacteraceae bacterium]|nr:aminotransferase class V-fold PLP-dependent enzyme [Bryobacteraceae bacterium]MDW8379588.1 aminotransferase class V-fold PLP-dependent enzyme [Bryobacterales bacterium]
MFSERRKFLQALAGGLPASWLAFQNKLAGAPPTSEDDWKTVKRQFPLADGLTYLNAANVCPASRPVLDRHFEYLRDFHADPSFQNREKYDKLQESLRRKLARLLGADPAEIAIVRNTSEGSNIIVQGLDLKEGDEILITSHNHPSSNHSWKVRAKRDRLVVREASVPVPARSQQQLIDSLASKITRKTRVLAVTHVTNTTGNKYPLEEIAQIAQKHGIWLHVDGAQSLGALEVNLHKIGCDSYAGSAHKWLMGPLENGVLYVRKEKLDRLWPLIVTAGWEQNPQDARKLEVFGQRDNPRLVAFEAAVDFLNFLGMARVEARLRTLVTHLKQKLAANPAVVLRSSMDWDLSGGVVKFTVRGVPTDQLYQELYAKHRIASARTLSGEAEGIRYSPHIYNTLEEMDYAADVLRSRPGA